MFCVVVFQIIAELENNAGIKVLFDNSAAINISQVPMYQSVSWIFTTDAEDAENPTGFMGRRSCMIEDCSSARNGEKRFLNEDLLMFDVNVILDPKEHALILQNYVKAGDPSKKHHPFSPEKPTVVCLRHFVFPVQEFFLKNNRLPTMEEMEKKNEFETVFSARNTFKNVIADIRWLDNRPKKTFKKLTHPGGEVDHVLDAHRADINEAFKKTRPSLARDLESRIFYVDSRTFCFVGKSELVWRNDSKPSKAPSSSKSKTSKTEPKVKPVTVVEERPASSNKSKTSKTEPKVKPVTVVEEPPASSNKSIRLSLKFPPELGLQDLETSLELDCFKTGTKNFEVAVMGVHGEKKYVVASSTLPCLPKVQNEETSEEEEDVDNDLDEQRGTNDDDQNETVDDQNETVDDQNETVEVLNETVEVLNETVEVRNETVEVRNETVTLKEHQTNITCCLCSHQVISASDLESHIDKMHSDIFSQGCNDCSFRAVGSEIMRNHKLGHGDLIGQFVKRRGIFSFTCRICDFEGESDDEVRDHIKHTHETNPGNFGTLSGRTAGEVEQVKLNTIN